MSDTWRAVPLRMQRRDQHGGFGFALRERNRLVQRRKLRRAFRVLRLSHIVGRRLALALARSHSR